MDDQHAAAEEEHDQQRQQQLPAEKALWSLDVQGEFEPRELRRGRAGVAKVRLIWEPVLGQVPAGDGPAGEADLGTEVGLRNVRNVDQLVARPRRVLELDGQ